MSTIALDRGVENERDRARTVFLAGWWLDQVRRAGDGARLLLHDADLLAWRHASISRFRWM